jgi:hypothetical protein
MYYSAVYLECLTGLQEVARNLHIGTQEGLTDSLVGSVAY